MSDAISRVQTQEDGGQQAPRLGEPCCSRCRHPKRMHEGERAECNGVVKAVSPWFCDCGRYVEETT